MLGLGKAKEQDCRACRQRLPMKSFPRHSNGIGRHDVCKQCVEVSIRVAETQRREEEAKQLMEEARKQQRAQELVEAQRFAALERQMAEAERKRQVEERKRQEEEVNRNRLLALSADRHELASIRQYCVMTDGEQIGPLSQSELKERAEEGKFRPTDRVLRDDWSQSIPLWQIAQFAVLYALFIRTQDSQASGFADLNGNGSFDTIWMDTDGDGRIDALVTDVDGDGQFDSVLADINGDGLADIIAIDTNADGLVDVVGVDSDHDGDIDAVGADLDYDGDIDAVDYDFDF